MKITLAAARVNAGMTQQEAADKVGVTKQTIYNMENNRNNIQLPTLLKLCEIYNISLDNLKLKEGE